MTGKKCPPLEVIAMHGWAGDGRCWEAWRRATESRGWNWQQGERGYGEQPPRAPHWSDEDNVWPQRVIIGHSLGPHLLPANVLARANIVVLLASFATFVPRGREGRRVRAALVGMTASLGDQLHARSMLTSFMQKVAEPQSPYLLPTGPLDDALDEDNRSRLQQDLDLLARCNGLPPGFPRNARVLIVEAEQDRIVEPEAQRMLREALPEADVITLPGVGHALLAGDVIDRVVEWVEDLRSSDE